MGKGWHMGIRWMGVAFLIASTVCGAETVAIPPFMKREPNGVCAVTSVVKTVFQNGRCSDFMLNVPCPESSLYQEIEWIEPVQTKWRR